MLKHGKVVHFKSPAEFKGDIFNFSSHLDYKSCLEIIRTMSFKSIGSNDPESPVYAKLDINFIHCSIHLFIIIIGLAHYKS